MRKLICLVTVLLLCVSFALPAFATDSGFVPSITYKPEPDITPVIDENGGEYIGVFRNAEGEIVSYVDKDCLIITPIAHVWDAEKIVDKVIEDLLLMVYDGLSDGSIKPPFDKFGADFNKTNMAVRDLFDARFVCEECDALLALEGITLEITLDLGVVADVDIYVATFDEETKEWEPIVSTVNNGDGTVTCVFEHLCAVSVSMPLATATAAVEAVAETGSNATPWIITLAAAVVAAAGVVIAKSKKKTAA